jgi:hypothetical protein
MPIMNKNKIEINQKIEKKSQRKSSFQSSHSIQENITQE